MRRKKEKTLVILIGTPRGDEVVWGSMYRHLLKPYNADLALCFEEQEDKSSSLYSKAKYLWEVPKYDDWEQYYVENEIQGMWKAFFDWAGQDVNCVGVSGIGESKGHGSGAILIAFRHYLLNNHLDVINSYDRIILTRSDYLYCFDHPMLDNEHYWVPEGETYGGIIDRFQQFPSKYAKEALSIMDYVCSEECYEKYAVHVILVNIERLIADHFDKIGFMDKVKTFERSNVLVVSTNDSNTGSDNRGLYFRGGSWDLPGFPTLKIKYIDEWYRVDENCFKHYVAKPFSDMV